MRERERERKKKNYSIRVNMHNYCSNFGYLNNFSLIDVKDFGGKMCKLCICKVLHPLMWML